MIIALIALINLACAQELNEVQTLKMLESEDGFLQSRRHKDHGDDSVTSGTPDYDFYVFSLGWSPSFCQTIPDSKACFDKLNKLDEPFMLRIHGLWPSTTDGKMMRACHQGSDIKIDVKTDVEPFQTMLQYWPSLNKNHFLDFWGHEYNRHGYCYTYKYNLDGYIPFFTKTLALYEQEKFNQLMKNSFVGQEGESVQTTYNEIISKFSQYLDGEYFEVQCNKKKNAQLITEVRFYYDLDFKPINGMKYHTNCDKNREIIIPFNLSSNSN